MDCIMLLFYLKNCGLQGASKHLSYKLTLKWQRFYASFLPSILHKFLYSGVLLFPGDYPATVLAHAVHSACSTVTSLSHHIHIPLKTRIKSPLFIDAFPHVLFISPRQSKVHLLVPQNPSFIVTQHWPPHIVAYWYPRSFPFRLCLPWRHTYPSHHSVPRGSTKWPLLDALLLNKCEVIPESLLVYHSLAAREMIQYINLPNIWEHPKRLAASFINLSFYPPPFFQLGRSSDRKKM